MKRMTLSVIAAWALCGSSGAQTISEAICGSYENIMANVVLGYRDQGLPVGIAEEIFNSEDDVRTRVFLKQVVREIYANPDAGREYIKSGEFRAACIKTHQGY